MPTLESTDVVIIGSGIMGAGTAYALMQAPTPPKRVVMIERDTSFLEGSTGRSAGGVRHQFSTPENILLSKATLTLLSELKQRFGADAADPGFKEQGYLYLVPPGSEHILKQNAATQAKHGGNTKLYEAPALAQNFPWLNTDGVALGSYGASGEGWLDPVILSALLRKAAIARGVELIQDTVTGFGHTSAQVETVTCASGRTFAAGHVVLASGAWTGALAKLLGVAVPVEPRKRFVFVVDCKEASDALRKGPLTIDTTGVWFRPEGRTFLCGISPEEKDEPLAENLDQINYQEYEDIVWPAMAARVQVFENQKMLSAWAGYYDYNTLDQNAIIGRHPAFANMYVVSGFSGHGLQQGYAAGRGIAELILYKQFREIDLTCFGLERIIANRPLLELNII